MHRFATFALLVGCAVPTLDYAELDDAMAVARCERFVTCGVFPDVATCTKYFGPQHDANVAAAIAAGKIAYHGDAGKLCAESLATVACDTTTNVARALPQSCTQMFEGELATGAICNLDEECESRRCVLPADAMCAEGACCPGICGDTNLGAADDACVRSNDCNAGDFCGGDHVCHALGADGDTCTTDAQCGVGLACSLGACRAPGAIGERCLFGRCADLGANCDTDTTCKPLGGPGAACTDGSQCSPFAECTAAHVCALVPSLGQACDGRCTAESWCNPDSNLCATPLPDGAPCPNGASCLSNHCAEGPVFDACKVQPVCD